MGTNRIYGLLQKDSIEFDHAIFTSGRGGDYRVTAMSSGILRSEITDIEKNALVKYYIPPDIVFVDAIRRFPLKSGRIGVSYVMEAGRDEYGRPERFRAHVILLPADIARDIIDPRIFRAYFIKRDIFGDLNKLKINVKELLNLIYTSHFRVKQNLKSLLNILDEREIVALFASIFNLKKTIIIPPEEVYVETIEKKNFMTTMDLLSGIFYILPSFLKLRISYTTFAIHGELEKGHIIFLHSLGILPKEGAIIIDMNEKVILDERGRKREIRDKFVSQLLKIILDCIDSKDFLLLDAIISALNNSHIILEKMSERGLRFLYNLLDNLYEMNL